MRNPRPDHKTCTREYIHKLEDQVIAGLPEAAPVQFVASPSRLP